MAKKHNEPGKSTISEVTVKVEDTLAKEATAQPEATKEVAADEIPALPADFQTAPNPLNDFVENGGFPRRNDPADRFIRDGKFTPYRAYNMINEKPNLIVEKSNELARTIWPDVAAYVKANESLNNISTNKDYLKETYISNRKFYDQSYTITMLTNTLSIGPMGGFGAGYLYPDKIEEVVRKLKRLERKNSNEEIFDDVVREQIINYILLPSASAGTQYDRYGSLNLSYPEQKVVINEILTKEDVSTITAILNYIPQTRTLLMNCFDSSYRINKKDMSVRLSSMPRGYTGDDSTQPTTYDRPISQSDKLVAMLSMHRFLSSSIPYDVMRDLAPALAENGTSMHLHTTNMYNASRNMREASLNYIRDERGLGELLQKISEYASSVIAYFSHVNNQLNQLFGLLNRLDISYETLLNDADEYIHSTVPW